MKTKSIRTRALACALLAGTAFCGLSAQPAAAQTARQHRALDANGVDLTHGDFVLAFIEGSIGSGEGELALVRSRIGSGIGGWHVSPGGHQWDLLYLTRNVGPSATTISVNKDNRYELFYAPGTLATGSTLTGEGGEYQYRTADGTVVVFSDPSGSSSSASTYCNGSEGQGTCSLLPFSITSPDGRTVYLGWHVWHSCEAAEISVDHPQLDCSYWARLDNVSNSFGYRIAFAYVTDGDESFNGVPPPDTWQRRKRADLFNDLVSTTTPQASIAYEYPTTSIVDVTDTAGRAWRFTAAANKITGIRRPGVNSDSTTITYGGEGGTVSRVVSDGVRTDYEYHAAGGTATMKVTPVLDPNSTNPSTTVTSNLAKGRPTSVIDPLTRTTAYEYDGSGRLTKAIANEGNYVQYTYDARGNVIRTEAVPKSGSGATIVTTALYPGDCSQPLTCNRPVSTTDERGNTTTYSYNATHGGLETVTGPAVGGVQPQTRYTYTLIGDEYRLTGTSACRTATAQNPASCVGTADEVKSTIAYDANGNVATTTTGAGNGDPTATATTATTWNAMGDPAIVDGPLPGDGDKSYFHYQTGRRLKLAVTPDPDGPNQPLLPRATRTLYETGTGLPSRTEIGNVADPADPNAPGFVAAEAVEIAYDTHARPKARRLISQGTVYSLTEMSYDALGRPDCTAQRMNKALFATLDSPACQLAAQGSGAEDHGPDRIVKTVYDAAGRVAQVRSGFGVIGVEADEVMTTYTANGLVESVTDGENNKTTYAYDGHDRPVRTYYPLPAKGSGASATADNTANPDYEETAYELLAGGTRTSGLPASFRNRANETTVFGYDPLGRMTNKNLPGSELDVGYAYDLLGALKSASTSAQTLTFGYDALGRQISQTDGSRIYSSAYDPAGRRTRITHPDGFFVAQEYLATGEMTTIKENGSFVLAAFGYDQLGRRTSLTFGNGEQTLYSYDAVSRLQTLTHDLGGALTTNDNTIAFTYNPAGQIVKREATNSAYSWNGHGNGTTGSTVDGLNRLTAQGGTGFSYDAKGNMLADGIRTYTYDSENRLTDTSATIPYYYDPLGRLAGAGTPLAIHYENYVDGLVAERLASSSTVSMRHVFGPGTDEPIVWYNGSGTGDRRFLHADERGSIVAVTSQNQALLAINRYDEYGRTQTSGTAYGRFLYTGQRYFGGIDLYYYKNRFYSPNAGGRFLQPDPIGYGGGMNLYAYVAGDPVNFTDPLGLKRLKNPGCPPAAAGIIQICGGGSGIGTGAAALMGSRGHGAGVASGSDDSVNSDVDGDGLPDPDIIVIGKRPSERPISHPSTLPPILASFYNGPHFCEDPTVGALNRFNPLGRVNTGRIGGSKEAKQDLNTLAVLNGLVPTSQVYVTDRIFTNAIASPVPFPIGEGWYMYTNIISNYTILGNSGLQYRHNMDTHDIRLDIPSGFLLPNGDRLTMNETCHYN